MLEPKLGMMRFRAEAFEAKGALETVEGLGFSGVGFRV